MKVIMMMIIMMMDGMGMVGVFWRRWVDISSFGGGGGKLVAYKSRVGNKTCVLDWGCLFLFPFLLSNCNWEFSLSLFFFAPSDYDRDLLVYADGGVYRYLWGKIRCVG